MIGVELKWYWYVRDVMGDGRKPQDDFVGSPHTFSHLLSWFSKYGSIYGKTTLH